MSREVLLTGFGVRTAFGTGADPLREGVFDGRPAFAPITRFDTGPYRTGVAATGGGAAPLREVLAEVAGAAAGMAGLRTGAEAAVLVGTAGDFTGLTRFWRGTDAPGSAGPGPSAGATGAASARSVPEEAASVGPAPRGTPRAEAAPVETVPAWQAEALADALGLRGPRLAFTGACVASATAVAHACALIASGRADIAVCAGAYLVEEENLAKFGSGFALSGDGMMRPFCADRGGLLLGDGAAAVVLESAEGARRRGARALGALTGWGAASDAHHIARPHPEGAGLVAAARRALRRAGGPRIDYVNAHGTATTYNDPAETRGLRTLFGADADRVPVSSTKSTTGHLLEASGVVELVITLLALRDGVLPPTAGFTAPDPVCDLDYVPNRPHKADLRRALTVNAAFGGANTALILERA
ncbi:beta-ketoacyl-[acyl-carrier-protein] synthase family protein [Streptomyces hygroscopicus]|uniref:beta-ketoacyl-[acyl-carrier-protein] synthase family protein n=1 Tax=Streptomyces hygroscopicus TaxID=1912 RepID=UPI000785D0C5|nr:beta-ketoacyl synthase N-terminal-like domain-containing protein [Streptomyces hygroscopicus]MBW8092174.1 beta-ketoacyl-[acyl-carrier-protein] synthase family protein [Streptomyces hygroscopicus subsp. hygroscopicus]